MMMIIKDRITYVLSTTLYDDEKWSGCLLNFGVIESD
jgi:hypothetical protein